MNKYRVWVRLEEEYDDIEAESEEEAFEIASDAAISGGSWSSEVTLIEDDWDMLDDIEKSEYMRAMAERSE